MNHGCHARVRWPARQGGAALVVGLILLVVITLVGVGAMQTTTLQEKMAGNLRDSNLSFQAAEAVLRNCENILVQDYRFQVARLNSGFINTPPQARPMDQIWQLGNPSTPAVVAGPDVWIWSLDENQAGFPAGTRLDPNPNPATTPFWWAEAGRDGLWWASAASNSQAIPANTLDGLFADPRCILEAYTFGVADNGQAANAFRRHRHTDGITIKNEVQFRRERNYYRMTSRGVGGSDTAVNMLQSGIYQIYFVAN